MNLKPLKGVLRKRNMNSNYYVHYGVIHSHADSLLHSSSCNNGRLLVVLYSFIEERRWIIRSTLMLIYPLRIYTSCIPHGVDNNIIHIRGCGKTDLLLLRVTYMEILPASHPTVYIYADS